MRYVRLGRLADRHVLITDTPFDGGNGRASRTGNDHMLLDVFSDYCNMPLLSILAVRKASRHIEESKNSSTGNEYRETAASLTRPLLKNL